jgi:hypothetical protein
MGSIASHPKVPAAAQTVYVPVYTPAATASSVAQVDQPAATTPDTSTAAGLKNSNLLERSRGILSTVLTGFRGILSETNAPQRKTLLGE